MASVAPVPSEAQGKPAIAPEASPLATTSFDSITAYRRCGCYRGCCPSNSGFICGKQWWAESVVGVNTIHIRRLTESYFFSDNVVLAVRIVLTLWSSCVLLAGIIINFDNGYTFFFFTILSYLGLCFYFWMATVLTIMYRLDPNRIDLDKKAPRLRDIICTIGYTTSFGFHIVVPVTYWALLSSSFNFNTASVATQWANVSLHGLDFFIILVEFFMNRIVFRWGHILVAYLVFYIYVFWSWIAVAIYPTGGPYGNGFPYFFVNYNTIAPAIVIPSLSVVFIFIWALLMMLHYWKCRLAIRRKHRTPKEIVLPMEELPKVHPSTT